MKRRSFLKRIGGIAGTCVLGAQPLRGGALGTGPAEMATAVPRRILGRTGEKISLPS